MLVEQPKKSKSKIDKQQSEDKQLWSAFGQALHGQMNQAVAQQQEA